MSGVIDVRVRPAAGTPQGALVLLHGRGADEHDLHGPSSSTSPSRSHAGRSPAWVRSSST